MHGPMNKKKSIKLHRKGQHHLNFVPYWQFVVRKDYTDERGNVTFIYTHAYENSYIVAIPGVLLWTGTIGILTPHCEILAKVLNKELPSQVNFLFKKKRHLCVSSPKQKMLLLHHLCWSLSSARCFASAIITSAATAAVPTDRSHFKSWDLQNRKRNMNLRCERSIEMQQ